MAELQQGAIFAGHRIEGIAGRGGFGVVYRATHLHLDHVVALKLISSGRAGDENFRERFKSESRIAVSIRHPNVVAVHNAGEEDGLLFVTMDFIEGTDLRGLLTREGRLDPETAVTIVRQLAAALDAAHEKGLVHRDIKPGNVLIDERNGAQHVYLTDFGLSKQMDATSGVTASGAFVGTLDYVAPEQIRGDRLDARTDVYALGCVMFELLSGDVPFASQQEKVAKIYAHLQEQPPELIDAAPEVPAALSEVVWRSMSKAPDDRHPSAGDFARAAAAALEGRQPSEPERNVGIGAAAPTQAFDVLAAAAAGAAAAPETAEAAGPETAEPEIPETAESPAPEVPAEPEEMAEPTTAGETVTVPPPPPRAPERSTQPDAPAPAGKGSGRGRVLAGIVALAALAAGAYAVLGGGGDGGGDGGDDRGGGGTGGSGGGEAVSVMAEVPGKPVGIAVSGNDVWVSSRQAGVLTRLDTSGKVQGRVDLAGEGEQVEVVERGDLVEVAEEGDLFIAVGEGEGVPGHVLHLNPEGEEIAQTPTDFEPRGIAIGKEYVWSANIESDTVTRVDPTDATGVSFPVGDGPARAAPGDDVAKGTWISNSEDGSLSRITEFGDTVTPIPDVGDTPRGIAVGAGKVWVAVQGGDQLAQIDPGSGAGDETVEKSANVGQGPVDVAFGLNFLWVTNAESGSVSRVDPKSLEVTDIPDVGPDPEGITVDEDTGVWVTSGGKTEEADGTVVLIDPDEVG